MSIENILENIKTMLESEASIDAGAANPGTVSINANVVTFEYPAPVASGACKGSIEVFEDGSIWDDVANFEYVNFDAWLSDFNEILEDM